MNQQNKGILETIVWFDIFEWPLTSVELQKYAQLENSDEEAPHNAIENFNGFYFLKNRSRTTPIATLNNAEIVKKRILRQKIAIKKIKIGGLAAKILSFVPFIRMVAICNDLAYFNAPSESDIDFFVVVKSGRIWTTRFLTTVILFVFRLWRHGKKIKNRICLSFFITDNNLSLEEIAYKDDVYLKFWVLQILPLLDKDSAYQNFLKENSWATKDFPGFFRNLPSQKIEIETKILQIFFEKILEGRLGNFLEKILKSFQLKIMARKKPARRLVRRSPNGEGGSLGEDGKKDVIISDEILKFHENDRRKYFRNIFQKKLKEI